MGYHEKAPITPFLWACIIGVLLISVLTILAVLWVALQLAGG